MKIGIRSGHFYYGGSFGGGYQAAKWHILACKALGHEVVVHTTNAVGKWYLDHWFDGVPLKYYLPGVEKEYDVFIDLNHFDRALPGAKKLDLLHAFFPQPGVPAPAEGVRIYSNSAYTARHIKHNWGREATPLYIPIDQHFHSGDKTNTIVHVGRFAQPNEWSDKAQMQLIQVFKVISKRLPGWKLVLIGSPDPGQEFYLDQVVRLASGYNIDVMPSVSDEKKVDILSHAAICWHATGVSLPTIASAQEHMGIAPLEAQASGCVPIVYNSGGMPEVVRANETGLLFDNISDLPALTLSLVDNWSAWSRMSQAGQMWASSWMNWENFVGRVDDMLNDRPLRPMLEWRPQLKYQQEDVTCVIPTMGSPLLTECLVSLNKTAPRMHVLVVNNASENLVLDESVDQTNIEIFNAGQNLGYAGAMKLAENVVRAPMILAFNDDVIAQYPGWLENMLLLMGNDSVGIVGAKLLFPDGRLQHAGGVLDFNRPDVGYHRFYGNPDCVEASTPQECDFVTGACLLARRELFHVPDELIGNLNYEELWMSMGAREKGFKTVYQPASVLAHREGNTKSRTPETQEKIERSRKAFINKWGDHGNTLGAR